MRLEELPPELPVLLVGDPGTPYAGVEYVSIDYIRARWPEVTAQRVRYWALPVERGGTGLNAVTLHELAAAKGLQMPDDGSLAATADGKRIYRLSEVETAERITRQKRVGAPRGGRDSGPA